MIAGRDKFQLPDQAELLSPHEPAAPEAPGTGAPGDSGSAGGAVEPVETEGLPGPVPAAGEFEGGCRSDAPTQAASAAGQQKVRIRFEETDLSPNPANCFRTISSAEEILLDLAQASLRAPATQGRAAEVDVRVAARVAMGYHSAKRLAGLLSRIIDRHEAQFGPIDPTRSR
jgi:hypothetical protein